MRDLSVDDLATVREGLTETESGMFEDWQVEAQYQYYPELPDLIAWLKHSAGRQASSSERSATRAALKGGLRVSRRTG